MLRFEATPNGAIGTDNRGYYFYELERPGSYRITAVGGQGAAPAKDDAGTSGWGRGAKVSGVIEVDSTPKYVVIVVGKAGRSARDETKCLAGGGGGTFVFLSDADQTTALDRSTLVMAAGGGGGSCIADDDGGRDMDSFLESAHASAESSGNPGKSFDDVDDDAPHVSRAGNSSSGGGAGAGLSSSSTDELAGQPPSEGGNGGGRLSPAKDSKVRDFVSGGFGGGGGAKIDDVLSKACGGGAGYSGGGGASTRSLEGIVAGGGGGSKNNTTSYKEEWSGRDLEVLESSDGLGDGYVEIGMSSHRKIAIGDKDEMFDGTQVVRDFREVNATASDDELNAIAEKQQNALRKKEWANIADRVDIGDAVHRFRDSTFENVTAQEALAADLHLSVAQRSELVRMRSLNELLKREVHKAKQLAISENVSAFRYRVVNEGLRSSLCVGAVIGASVGALYAELLPVIIVVTILIFASLTFVGIVGIVALLASSRSNMRWKRWYRRMTVDEEAQ